MLKRIVSTKHGINYKLSSKNNVYTKQCNYSTTQQKETHMTSNSQIPHSFKINPISSNHKCPQLNKTIPHSTKLRHKTTLPRHINRPINHILFNIRTQINKQITIQFSPQHSPNLPKTNPTESPRLTTTGSRERPPIPERKYLEIRRVVVGIVGDSGF